MTRRLPLALLAGLTCLVSAWVIWGGDPSGSKRSIDDSSDEVTQRPEERRRPNAVFDVGQTVYITEKGFRPEQLVSIVERPVEWINETDDRRRVIFVTTRGPSPMIRPGDSWTFTPTASVSIAYHDAKNERLKGSIQVEPLDPSGDN